MPFIFIGIIGTGFLFAFYDAFDINVSFIQSCVALKHGCTRPMPWRWMYAVGAVLALIGVLLRLELPESARWLVGQGRLEEADKLVSAAVGAADLPLSRGSAG